MGKRKSWLIIGGLVAIVFVVVIVLVRDLNGPSTGQVSQSASVSTSTNKPTTYVTASDQYAYFQYPSDFITSPSSTPQIPVLATHIFIKNDTIPWELAVQVLQLPSAGLADSSSFQYRKANPNIYVETTKAIRGSQVIIMTDKSIDTYSAVAFLTHNSVMATVAVNGGDTTEVGQLQTVLNNVLSSWNWF